MIGFALDVNHGERQRGKMTGRRSWRRERGLSSPPLKGSSGPRSIYGCNGYSATRKSHRDATEGVLRRLDTPEGLYRCPR